MCANYEEANNIINKYGQEHLLYGYEKLEDSEKQKLVNQIMNIDFDQINNLFKNIKNDTKKEKEKIEPIAYIEKSEINETDGKRYFEKQWKNIKFNR